MVLLLLTLWAAYVTNNGGLAIAAILVYAAWRYGEYVQRREQERAEEWWREMENDPWVQLRREELEKLEELGTRGSSASGRVEGDEL